MSALQKAHKLRHQFEQRQQVILDALTPHLLGALGRLRRRWCCCMRCACTGSTDSTLCRTVSRFTCLNLLLGFLSPRVDPEFASLGIDEDEDDGCGVLGRALAVLLPRRRGGGVGVAARCAVAHSHRPGVQAFHSPPARVQVLARCRARHRCSRSFSRFFPFLDIPVFWPILVVYFFALFFVTMRKQIQHMIKHKYIPFLLSASPSLQLPLAASIMRRDEPIDAALKRRTLLMRHHRSC
jgi:hypothetical protein